MGQGVYVLTDSAFRPFARMSMAVRGEAISIAQAVWTALSYPMSAYNLQSLTGIIIFSIYGFLVVLFVAL